MNLDRLNKLSNNNTSFIKEILSVFLNTTPDDIQHLQNNVDTTNWEKVRYYSHKLKSSTFTLGIEDAFIIFQKIEEQVKGEIYDTVVYDLERARKICDAAILEAQKHLEELN